MVLNCGVREDSWESLGQLDFISNSMDMCLSKLREFGDGQGSLVCCSPWGCKALDTTEQLNWTEQNRVLRHNVHLCNSIQRWRWDHSGEFPREGNWILNIREVLLLFLFFLVKRRVYERHSIRGKHAISQTYSLWEVQTVFVLKSLVTL